MLLCCWAIFDVSAGYDFSTSQARRFITLIDELYNHHCCLYCAADSSVEDLFQGTEEGTLFDLERCVILFYYPTLSGLLR